MNKIALVVMFSAFVGFFQLAKAQSENASQIAYINSMELLNAMPAKKAADEQLKKLADQKKAEINKQQEAFSAKYNKIQEDLSKKSQTELEGMKDQLQKMEQEFQAEQENLVALREEAANALDKKQAELYDPIMKKAQDAVDAVAKEKGYLYVFDTSQPSLIYAAGPNILASVKAKLGL